MLRGDIDELYTIYITNQHFETVEIYQHLLEKSCKNVGIKTISGLKAVLFFSFSSISFVVL